MTGDDTFLKYFMIICGWYFLYDSIEKSDGYWNTFLVNVLNIMFASKSNRVLINLRQSIKFIECICPRKNWIEIYAVHRWIFMIMKIKVIHIDRVIPFISIKIWQAFIWFGRTKIYNTPFLFVLRTTDLIKLSFSLFLINQLISNGISYTDTHAAGHW
jgi:hypothetical protein